MIVGGGGGGLENVVCSVTAYLIGEYDTAFDCVLLPPGELQIKLAAGMIFALGFIDIGEGDLAGRLGY